MNTSAVIFGLVVAGFCTMLAVSAGLAGKDPLLVGVNAGLAVINTLICIWNIAIQHAKMVRSL